MALSPQSTTALQRCDTHTVSAPRQQQRRQRGDVHRHRDDGEPQEKQHRAEDGHGIRHGHDALGTSPCRALRSRPRGLRPMAVSAVAARYFTYSQCSTRKARRSCHQPSRSMLSGSTGIGHDRHVRHGGLELGKASGHVVARRDEEKRAVMVEARPGACLPGVAVGVLGRVAQIGAAIEARAAMRPASSIRLWWSAD